MGYTAAPLERLIEEFSKFKGIGAKNATRMAYQVMSMTDEEAQKLATYCRDARLAGRREERVKIVCMVGGESIVEQSSLASNGCDVLIGTPGRIVDCLERHFLVLNQANYVGVANGLKDRWCWTRRTG